MEEAYEQASSLVQAFVTIAAIINCDGCTRAAGTGGTIVNRDIENCNKRLSSRCGRA
jgi:hypothetical protein